MNAPGCIIRSSRTGTGTMDKVVVMAFTAKGHAMAEKIAQALGGDCIAHRVTGLNAFVPGVFAKGNTLVFVGAAGIAVRAVARMVGNKADDPAVIVVDELGRYVIPILSGHLGGANLFAEKLAGRIHAVPVITTATDINRVFSVDTFAVQNGYALDPENVRYISGALLDRREVGLCTAFEIVGELPENIVHKTGGDVGIYIGCESVSPFSRTLRLMPKCFHVGIGTRRNIPFEALRDFFLETLADAGVPLACVGTISSIDLKKDEDAIVRLASAYGIGFITYTAEQLREYAPLFEQSDFVRDKTGVGNVCEAAAYLSSKKGGIIAGKRAKDGMTAAIAREAWRVVFENNEALRGRHRPR